MTYTIHQHLVWLHANCQMAAVETYQQQNSTAVALFMNKMCNKYSFVFEKINPDYHGYRTLLWFTSLKIIFEVKFIFHIILFFDICYQSWIHWYHVNWRTGVTLSQSNIRKSLLLQIDGLRWTTSIQEVCIQYQHIQEVLMSEQEDSNVGTQQNSESEITRDHI
jgi:hypothetical protein